jgi:uncharacterized repeat protein (TIGR01451 family)
VKVDSDFLGTSISNTANASATAGQRSLGSAPNSLRPQGPITPLPITTSATLVTAIAHTSNLALTKTASAGPIAAGDTFVWTLDVSNLGPDEAADITVVDPVPSPLQVVSATSADFACTVADNTVTCTRATLDVNASGSIAITTLVPLGTELQSLTNLASVALVGTDPVTPNNSDAHEVMVGSEAPTTTPTTVTPTPPTMGTLPVTGGHEGMPLGLAAILSAVGVACIGVSRRRRRA